MRTRLPGAGTLLRNTSRTQWLMTQMMKKIRRAESRALKSSKEKSKARPSPYNLGNRSTEMKPLLIQLSLTCMYLLFQLSSPFVGATHDVSHATGTCVTNVNSMDTGVRTVHSTGTSCSQRRTTYQDKVPYDTSRFTFDSNDKYFYCNVLDSTLDTNIRVLKFS